MLKSLIVFGLTRRPIILLGVLVFVAAGLLAFSKLNIEAYPNPAPVIHRDHRAGGGSVRRGDGALLHDSDGGGPLPHARRRHHPLDLVLRAVVRARHLQVRRRLLFRGHPGGAVAAAERQPSEQRAAADPGIEPGRRNLSLSGGRPAELRADQPAHRPGLDPAAPLSDRAGRRPGQHLGRHHQAVRGRGRPP